MEKSDYAVLAGNTERFVDFINHDLNRSLRGSKEYTPDQFSVASGYLNLFESFPIVAYLEEIKKMREALEISKTPGGFFSSTKYMEEAAATICENTRPLVTILRQRAQELKQEKEPSKKDTMIQLIRKYNGTRTKLNEAANQYGYDFSKAVDIWFKHYKQHHTSLLGVLNEFKSWDPDLEGERGFYEAEKKLNEEYDLAYSSKVRDQIDSLMSSCDDIETMIGIVKVDYGIKEDEIGPSEEAKILEEELVRTREELKKSQENNIRLLEQLVSPTVAPKQDAPQFSLTDVDEVEGLVAQLSDIITFATDIEDGELQLNFPIQQIERIYSNMRNALENTEYIILFGQAENILANIHNFGNNKGRLLNITKDYIQNVRLELDRYNRRIGREGRLRRHL